MSSFIPPLSSPSPPSLILTLLAHVDHGKTTLCDLLLSHYHNSISTKSVGEARVMDNTDEEVRRGITIRSGYMSITVPSPPSTIGILDSPGHCDFQSEVSDSLLLSHLGVLLVDVAEGVLCRTVGVLRVLKKKNILLVVNKMDRAEGDEWDGKCQRILENVNAVRAGIFNDVDVGGGGEQSRGGGQMSEGKVKGIEVVVGSAKEGWGGSIIGVCECVMRFVNERDGRDVKVAEVRKFARMVYEGKVGVRFNFDEGDVKIVKIIKGGDDESKGWNILSLIYSDCLDISANHGRSGSDQVLKVVKSRMPWFFPTNVDEGRWVKVHSRDKVVEGGGIMHLIMPMGREVVEGGIRLGNGNVNNVGGDDGADGEEGWIKCGRTRVEVTGNIKKLVTMGKVEGGRVKKSGRWTLVKQNGSLEIVTVRSMIVVCRGTRRVEVEDCGEGGIVIMELESETVWDSGWIGNGAVASYGAVVRCKVENVGERERGRCMVVEDRGTRAITFTLAPLREDDRKVFNRGIERVHRLEPGAVVRMTDRGEVTVSVGGEVEMENLVHDLKSIYMDGVEIKVGERLVEGREGIGEREEGEDYWRKGGDDEQYWDGEEGMEVGSLEIPLFRDMVESLRAQGHGMRDGNARIVYEEGSIEVSIHPLPTLEDGETVEGKTSTDLWLNSGSNYLLSKVGESSDLRPLLTSAFIAFVKAGPIMEEPVHGVAVVVQEVLIKVRDEIGGEGNGSVGNVWGGQRVGTVTQAMRVCCLTRRTMVYEPYCMCEFQSTLSSSSHAYTVISKRRGKVVGEEMLEGTDLIGIQSVIPMAEMGGITRELLERSSGEASAPIVEFDHWGECEGDPFWRPKEESEREEWGEGGKMGDNIAGRVVRKTRKRKGLRAVYEEEKIVVEAEKLRNLKTKK